MTVRKVIGVIDPRCLYTTDGLMEFAGIGGQSLRDARRAGLKRYEFGRRVYYRGKDVIRCILRVAAKRDRSGSTGEDSGMYPDGGVSLASPQHRSGDAAAAHSPAGQTASA